MDGDERCECEAHPHSGFGVVRPEEQLARAVFESEIDLGSGTLKPEAVRIVDLKQRGWSLLRLDVVPRELFRSQCGMLEAARRDAQRLAGVVVQTAAEIRAIEDEEGMRALCVIDDETQDLPNHASARVAAAYPRSALKQIRKRVMDLFEGGLRDLTRL